MVFPLVSVVIPVYNAGPYIGEAIESIISQSYKPIEILIIDDGSSDSSAEVLKTFKNIRYVHQAHGGPSKARNLGISLALGKFVAFHDADDICMPNRVTEQMGVLLSDATIEVVYSRIQNFIDVNAEVPRFFKTNELMKPRMGFISSALMRKTVFEKVGLFNEGIKIGEDIDWMVRAENRSVCSTTIPEVLVKRRLHETNLSSDIEIGHRNLAKILLAKTKLSMDGIKR